MTNDAALSAKFPTLAAPVQFDHRASTVNPREISYKPHYYAMALTLHVFVHPVSN